MIVTNVFTVQAAAMNTITAGNTHLQPPQSHPYHQTISKHINSQHYEQHPKQISNQEQTNTTLAGKWQRCSEIAMENNLPFIQLLESAGADLNQQFEAFHVSPNPFYNLAKMSKKKIPSICVVLGTCIAGGAYMGGMSDYNIMIKNQSHLALAGEKLVFMATGEKSSSEELGGAEMHSTKSGVSDFLASNEQDALMKAREVVSTFPVRKPTSWETQKIPVQEPFYHPDEILGLLLFLL